MTWQSRDWAKPDSPSLNRRPRCTFGFLVPDGGSSLAFAGRALEEEGVVVLPGAALGAGGEGFFRIALTVDEGRMREAAARLGRLVVGQGGSVPWAP